MPATTRRVVVAKTALMTAVCHIHLKVDGPNTILLRTIECRYVIDRRVRALRQILLDTVQRTASLLSMYRPRDLIVAIASTCAVGGLAATPAQGAESGADAPCVVPATEKMRLLALPYQKFDTDTAKFAWRSLNARNCADNAIKLIGDYVASHPTSMTIEQQSEALFHAGQALAFANRNTESIRYFERALALATKEEWVTYVAAHVAYANGDLAKLRHARDRYAAIAPGSMRLGFLDGMLKCPDLSYMEAANCGR